MADSRSIIGGIRRWQGPDEEITWTLDVTHVGTATGALSNLSMTVTDEETDTDVSAAVTSGAMSAAGQVITLEAISGLTENTTYRVDVQFDKDGHTLGVRFWLECE